MSRTFAQRLHSPRCALSNEVAARTYDPPVPGHLQVHYGPDANASWQSVAVLRGRFRIDPGRARSRLIFA